MASSAKIVKTLRVALAGLNNLIPVIEDEKITKEAAVKRIRDQLKPLNDICEEENES